jgi:hypothetical protein
MWYCDNFTFETEDEARDDLWINIDLYEKEIQENGISYSDLFSAILSGSRSEISNLREKIEEAVNLIFEEYYQEIEEEEDE